jgi:hypothetical protein
MNKCRIGQGARPGTSPGEHLGIAPAGCSTRFGSDSGRQEPAKSGRHRCTTPELRASDPAPGRSAIQCVAFRSRPCDVTRSGTEHHCKLWQDSVSKTQTVRRQRRDVQAKGHRAVGQGPRPGPRGVRKHGSRRAAEPISAPVHARTDKLYGKAWRLAPRGDRVLFGVCRWAP